MLVSFERVFEVINLPVDVGDKADALVLDHAIGALVFEDVSFRYDQGATNLLNYFKRPGQLDSVTASLSGTAIARTERPGRAQAANGVRPASPNGNG